MAQPKTIFVQIVSYRDSECKFTIDDLFKKAANPGNIYVGLNWQYSEEDDDVPFYDHKYSKNIRMVKYPYQEAKGVCWARSLTQKLYEGEDYTLSIDAHMRFVEGWDTILIEMIETLQREGYAKPVISHYPPDYTLEGDFGTIIKKMSPVLREKDGIFIYSRSGHEVKIGDGPILSACIAAGFNFTLGQSIKDVPYDDSLYFFGEEISLAARLWTHGYDFFNPDKITLYHLYKRRTVKPGKVVKSRDNSLHIHDHDAANANLISKKRVKHLLGTQQSTDPDVLKNIEHYGLGSERSLHQFEQFSGLDFKKLTRRVFTRTAMMNAKQIPTGQSNEIKELLLQSKSKSKKGLHERLVTNLKRLGITSILHLSPGTKPNGLEELDIHYLGVEIDAATTEDNQLFYHNKSNINFVTLNYAAQPLPRMDCLFLDLDLPIIEEKLLWSILRNCASSQTTYLCMISDSCFLQQSPYFFCAPDFIIPLGHEYIYLWHHTSFASYADALLPEESELRHSLLTCTEQHLHKVSDKETRETVEEYITIQSRGEVRKMIYNPQVNQACEENPAFIPMIETLIDVRFKRLNSATHDAFPMVTDKNSVLAMTILCDYFENKQNKI